MKRILVLGILGVFLLSVSACEKTENNKNPSTIETENNDLTPSVDTEDTVGDQSGEEEGSTKIDTAEDPEITKMKELFGQNCIAEQTFEVELSQYGKVYFVPYAPSAKNPEFSMQIIQNGEVLVDIYSYVPEKLAGEPFVSLDEVAFFDINYDDLTDIILVETYGDTSFAVVYYGLNRGYNYGSGRLFANETLSDNLTEELEVVSVSEIRNYLSNGKENGEFSDYKEAYEAVSRLFELDCSWELGYDLIYFDEDDIPELVLGLSGYYVSMYTYHDGKVYTLMDYWGYGAGGNGGYEYCPGKNSLRNFDADFAGAIVYTTYMAVNDQHSLELVVEIVTYNYEDEEASGSYYSESYIDKVEISEQEVLSYDVGEYEWIESVMSLEELYEKLNQE